MLISMNWISEFVDLSGLDKEELIRRFTLSTAEVEDIIHMGEQLRNVVVGKILTVEKHPDSKKLHLLTVDGGDKVYDVVCGAPNVREGLVIPFVKEGGRVGDMEICTAKIAGYESHGMCCSEAELGISADHSGLMELPADLRPGTDIRDVYNIRDLIFEVDNKSLTNRPDLWGHYGIAREFAALSGRELKPLASLDLSEYSSLSPIDIQVVDDLCLRYSGLMVRNVTRKLSPVNMRIRLYYCGMRAINFLADLTNYLMLEMGQPMHAFDSRRVSAIKVQRFDSSFDFKTLDGETRTVDENTLMICNSHEPVAIAGIMGGLESEIEDDTDSLLLESACFDPVSVRKSSTRLSLRTDASMRYEKTLDPEMTVPAIARFLYLLKETDGGVQVCSSLTDVYKKPYPVIELSFHKEYVNRYTGIDIDSDSILKTLSALGFKTALNGSSFSVQVPSWRATKDVTIKADIIEEITRIYGYDNFEVKPSRSLLTPVLPSSGNKSDSYAKDILVGHYGLNELHSYIWCDAMRYKALGLEVPDNVKLLNSMNPDLTVIRRSIAPTLLGFVDENKGFSLEFGVFEIGRTVDGLSEDGSCNEKKKLCIALYSRLKTEGDLFLSLRDMIAAIVNGIKHCGLSFENCTPAEAWQHPANTANILVKGECIGLINTLYPVVKNRIDKKAAIVCAELDMDCFAQIPTDTIRYAEPSKYPGIDIDLSLVLSGTQSYAQLCPAWDNATPLLRGVSLVDVYEDEGQKSLTLRFSFASMERTLSKQELQVYIDQILELLQPMGVKLKT